MRSLSVNFYCRSLLSIQEHFDEKSHKGCSFTSIARSIIVLMIISRNDNFFTHSPVIPMFSHICATHGVPILLTRCQSLAAQQCLRVHCASVKSPRSLAGAFIKDSHPFPNIVVLSSDGCSDLDFLLELQRSNIIKYICTYAHIRLSEWPKILMYISSLVLVMVYFRLEWKAPEDNGGSQIVQYEVCCQQHCLQLVHFNIHIYQ